MQTAHTSTATLNGKQTSVRSFAEKTPEQARLSGPPTRKYMPSTYRPKHRVHLNSTHNTRRCSVMSCASRSLTCSMLTTSFTKKCMIVFGTKSCDNPHHGTTVVQSIHEEEGGGELECDFHSHTEQATNATRDESQNQTFRFTSETSGCLRYSSTYNSKLDTRRKALTAIQARDRRHLIHWYLSGLPHLEVLPGDVKIAPHQALDDLHLAALSVRWLVRLAHCFRWLNSNTT